MRFQIFLVDENQIAYATDLSCEATPIYEYEGIGFLFIIITDMSSECSFFSDKERENLPAPFGSKRKGQTKRSQQESTTVV